MNNKLDKFSLLLVFIILFFQSSVYAQGEIETEREPDNYNENSFGFKLNSNGFGADYRFSQRINFKLRYFYEAQINFQKDPKEVKVINPYFNESKKFVYGKMNSFQNLKLGFGISNMFIEKQDKGSISVHAIFTAGGIIGIEKPIYYELVDSSKDAGDYVVYYTNIHRLDIHKYNPTDVYSKAPFKYGLDEIKIVPGIFIKSAVGFDLSKNVMKTNVIEGGVEFDFYFRKIEIMAENKRNIFLNVYISYRFGSKYNALLSREVRKNQRIEQNY